MKKLSLSNRIVRDIHTEWNELTFQELCRFMALTNDKKKLTDIRVQLFLILSGLEPMSKPSLLLDGDTWHWFYINDQKILISATQMNWASNQVLNFFKSKEVEDEMHYYPYSTLTRNIFPELVIDKLRFIGPSDGLTNITYKEFTHAESCYYNYVTTNNERELDKLITILFRQKERGLTVSSANYKGDLRIPFNDYQIDYFADLVSGLNPEIKQGIKCFYEGCTLLIRLTFPYIFKPGAKAEKVDVAMNMIKIVDELTNHVPHETEINMNEQAYMVLSSLNNLLAKREKEHE